MEDEAGEESRCLHLTALCHLQASSFSTDVVDCDGGVAPLLARLRLSAALSILRGRLPPHPLTPLPGRSFSPAWPSEDNPLARSPSSSSSRWLRWVFPFRCLPVHSAHPQVVSRRRHLQGLPRRLAKRKMKLVKNPCLRLTALRRCHTASSSTDAAATDFNCDGGVGTRSDVKHQKPSSNASPHHLKYQLYSLLGSTSPGRLSAALSMLRGMLPPDSTSPPDAATRSIVFSGLAKRSQPLNEESLALLVEMAKMGLFPHDAILFTQFITKLCRCGATSGAWDFFPHDAILSFIPCPIIFDMDNTKSIMV
ncbi:hypothetical protein ZIOFF_013289 [Zingiber officinale]|uniref:Pentatricopeptide repeat-containing protein n=1 Tax=Zingiber officinale TaxID=94328 RepID=A0A8J5HZE2_ZINOF|nr:hypothetical protein ZIOFF_013289 [Zingiber officinale]